MSSETNAHNSTDPVELWNYWNETTTRMWMRTLNSGIDAHRDPFGFYSLWMKPVTFFKQWDATSRIWAQMVGEVMSFEQLLTANYQFIEAYINIFINVSHLVNEVMFPNCQISTRPDIIQVAKLAVSLEERIYAIEDALINFEDRDLKVEPDQAVKGLARYPEYIEGKQDNLDTPSFISLQAEAIGDLAGRLERVESKLDILLAVLEKIEAKTHSEAI